MLFRSAPHENGLDSMAAAYMSTLSFQDKDGPFKEKQLDRVHFRPDSEFLKQLGPGRLNEKGDLICSITDVTDTIITIDLVDLPSDRSSFEVPRAEIQDYTKLTHKIYMNHPTTYPQSWYGPWLGTNYKFSQAGQDPRNPDYSGIQVLRDPGWMPKWIGCLMICFGIFTMFYLKPYMQGRREMKAVEAAKSETSKKNMEVNVRKTAKVLN